MAHLRNGDDSIVLSAAASRVHCHESESLAPLSLREWIGLFASLCDGAGSASRQATAGTSLIAVQMVSAASRSHGVQTRSSAENHSGTFLRRSRSASLRS